MTLGFSCDNSVFSDAQNFLSYWNGKIVESMILMSPILAALMVGSIAAGIIMSGLNFSPKAIELKFSHINPVEGFAKLINMQSLVWNW